MIRMSSVCKYTSCHYLCVTIAFYKELRRAGLCEFFVAGMHVHCFNDAV